MRRPSHLGFLALALFVCAAAADQPIQMAEREDGPLKGPELTLETGGHTALVSQVLFTPDGRQLVSASDDKTIRFWDVSTGELLRTLRPPIGTGSLGKLYALALAPDGLTLAAAGHQPEDAVLLIALRDGRITRLTGHRNVVHALAFSADGKHLASASADTTTRLWSLGATPKLAKTLLGHDGPVYGVCFSPDGTQIATASADKTARVWSVATGRASAILKGHENRVFAVAWRPDGKTIATGSWDRSIGFWAPDGTSRGWLDKLGNRATALTYSRDSTKLLCTRGGDTWDFTASIFERNKETARFKGHTNTASACALSPDGTLAATAGVGDRGGEIYLWSTSDGRLRRQLLGRGRNAVSAGWSEDGDAIAWSTQEGKDFQYSFRWKDLQWTEHRSARLTGQVTGPRHEQNGVRLEVDGTRGVGLLRGDRQVGTYTLTRNDDRVRCYTFWGSGRIAVGGSFGRIYVFDIGTGKVERVLRGHASDMASVAVSPDGRYLLSAADQTLRIWLPDKDQPLLSLFATGEDWIAWGDTGLYAASAGGEQLMGWHVNQAPDQLALFHPAAQFRKTLYRPDVVSRLLDAGSVARALTMVERKKLNIDPPPGHLDASLPPRVVIVSPSKSETRLSKPEIEVRAIATSRKQPVTAMQLLLNGRPYQGQAGVKKIAAPRPGEVGESWVVTLEPGKHRLAVVAESSVSQALSETVEVSYVGGGSDPVELPTLYVLAIGVADYPGELRLNYAAKDARAVENAFKEHSKSLYRKVETKTLTDKDATQRGIKQGLTWLRKEMTQRDVAVLFYSGHGMKDHDGRFYLLPIDVDTGDLLSTGVPDDDIKKSLQGIPGRVIAIFDACHAGAAGGDKRKGGLTDDIVRDLVTDDYGVIMMASSMGREFSLEDNEHRHSKFTVALLEGLSGKAANAEGAVYLHSLDAYITDRVKELSQGRQHPVTAKPTSIRSFPVAKP